MRNINFEVFRDNILKEKSKNSFMLVEIFFNPPYAFYNAILTPRHLDGLAGHTEVWTTLVNYKRQIATEPADERLLIVQSTKNAYNIQAVAVTEFSEFYL